MIDYADALALVLAESAELGGEKIALSDAAGRVLTQALRAPESLPPFDNTAMDGFALRVPNGGLPAGTRLARVGELAAGEAPGRHAIEADATGALEIMTGAPIPDGYNSVIPVEQTALEDDGRTVRLEQAVSPGQHIRRAGEDIGIDDALLDAGRVLDPAALALCAALGMARLEVARRPRVALINTGNEIVDPATERLLPGQIRNSNGTYLLGRLRAAGADCVLHESTGDDAKALVSAIGRAVEHGVDIVITTGAVSMGKYDFIPGTLAELGAQTIFHKVRMRPGKPILFARLKTGALVFGLPGNPASSAVGLRFFVEPAIRRMLGLPAEQPQRLPLRRDYPNKAGLMLFLKARCGLDGDGHAAADVLPGQESFRLRPLLVSNAWISIDANTVKLAAGANAKVFPTGHLDPFPIPQIDISEFRR